MKKLRFIRKKVERVIRLNGFPLKNCGNDEQKQSPKNVILGIDPGIQCVFNLNTKETKLIWFATFVLTTENTEDKDER